MALRSRLAPLRLSAASLAVLSLLAACGAEPDRGDAEQLPTQDVEQPTASAEETRADELERTAPSGDWKIVRLTADKFSRDYGFWYLEDEEFRPGQSLLRVPSLDVSFEVEECSSQSCQGSIKMLGPIGEEESEGHLYPWAGQTHDFSWDGQTLELTTNAEETEGVCYDVDTGKDLPGTSWTDKATYEYSDVTYQKEAGTIDSTMRVDYKTDYYPSCEGPTSMYMLGSIAFERAG